MKNLNLINPLSLPRSEEQISYLNGINEKIPEDGVIVEIGTYVGNCSLRFRNGKRKIFCIDTWDNISLGEAHVPQKWEEVLSTFMMNAGEELFVNVFPIRMPAEFVMQFFNLPIDFLYVDGDHTYDGVKRDILNWFPKVKSGGIIAGDDYGGEFTGVKQAVDELFSGRIRIYCGNQWIVGKV